MPESILKRKRPQSDSSAASKKPKKTVKTQPATHSSTRAKNSSSASTASKPKQHNDDTLSARPETSPPSHVSVQVITGSYERVLHGFVATLPISSVLNPGKGETTAPASSKISFTDTFLFSAHSSAVRSVAVSQSQAAKRILATGSSDERINLYQISSVAPTNAKANGSKPDLPSLSNTAVVENPRNRELGSLLHHARTITALQFPTKSKLFSAAEDNTIGITRTRDWTTLSTIKAPVPKPIGRPSGDTAGPGEVPSGVNDFAVHPSMKLMLSVSKGERCMRLWNLVTGKKAGVLNFSKEVLLQVGEGRYSTGEGRKVLWRRDGDGFVVIFERGVVVYGMESTPERIVRLRSGKICQVRFVPGQDGVLAVSTEDGRVLFFDVAGKVMEADEKMLPMCPCFAEIPTLEARSSGRIKDFEILDLSKVASDILLFITVSSDGAARIWSVSRSTLDPPATQSGNDGVSEVKESEIASVGTLLGVRETGNRLTCLTAFLMDDAVIETGSALTSTGKHQSNNDGDVQ